MKSIIILSFILFSNLSCQIDPNDYYPLHIGDKWEYLNIWTNEKSIDEVTGDTLMSNGFSYFILTGVQYTYQRVENNKYVKVYNEYAENEEFTMYDLFSPKGTIYLPWGENTYGYGIFDVKVDNNNIIGKELEWREFREVTVDTSVIPADTTWYNVVDSYWPRITQGIGFTTYADGLTVLIGVRINNVGYGTLTDVENEQVSSLESFELYQNYPNPFNPTTTISYQVPSSCHVSLKIYDVLGKEVATLVNENQEMGKYSVQFNAQNLSSGMYIYQIKAGDFVSSKKLLLMK